LYIGIDSSDGMVFEGGSTYGAKTLWPLPLFTPAKLISDYSEGDSFVVGEIDCTTLAENLFREDSFDLVTRIRRGRFYKRRSVAQPENWTVTIDPSVPVEMYPKQRRAVSFESVNPSDFEIKSGQQQIVILGSRAAFSIWTVIHKEVVHTSEVLVTLKARQSFGGLPEIDWGRLPDKTGSVRGKIESLRDDLYRAGAESIVDRAREAATAILSAYLQSEGETGAIGKDLGALTELLDKKNGKNSKRVVRCAAEIPQRLHSRGKHAEQEKHDNLRPICEQDAELAVLCIGVMLCDLGWAKWN
jgi:hypothetical protein